MRIAYLDCSSGISGDMYLGALVDAGAPLEKIGKGLKKLAIGKYRLEAREVRRAGISATKVDVIVGKANAKDGKPAAKTWKDVRELVNESSLPSHIKQKGVAVFKRLFQAEGKVHGSAYTKTHLHELGAVDCIVDVFGTLLGLELLGVERAYSSAINLGSGFVKTEHGKLPVPAPATAEILKGIPVYSSGVPFELTTPTGAVLVKETTAGSVGMPLMNIDRIGYGAGGRDLAGSPNVLRILVGDIPFSDVDRLRPRVTVIETNIDDMNPQIYEHVMELLFEAGALDVYLVPVIMKKGRPGIVLTILCEEDRRTRIMDIVFRETTTIGLRFHEVSRFVLEREVKAIDTELGRLKVKISRGKDGKSKSFAEYDECRRVARKYNIPLIEVMSMLAGKKLKTVRN